MRRSHHQLWHAGDCDDPAAGKGSWKFNLSATCQGYTPIVSERTGQNVIKGVVAYEGGLPSGEGVSSPLGPQVPVLQSKRNALHHSLAATQWRPWGAHIDHVQV